MSNRQGTEGIKVAVRMRPLLHSFEDEMIWAVNGKQRSIFTTIPSTPPTLNSMSAMKLNALKERNIKRKYAETLGPQAFSFDRVYGDESSTSEIYKDLGRPVIESVLNGYNASIFMYGQTTSGKTYTMLGSPDSPGILPCAIKDVFRHIEVDQDHEHKIWVSYLEIYNEQINDLLVPGSNNLRLNNKGNTGEVEVENLKRQQVWNFDQVIILMNYGEEHRAYRETNIHDHSSRSHTIFKLYLEQQDTEPTGRVRYSCMYLVDLAGSERLNEFDTRQQNVMGETGHINKSLFVLSNVIKKLAEKKPMHIPYRDSKLTRILSIALGGNAMSTIICTVSPASINYHVTLSTLRFAVNAKNVRNRPKINELHDEAASMQAQMREIERLRDELKQTQIELVECEKRNTELMRQLKEKEVQKSPRREQPTSKIDTFWQDMVYEVEKAIDIPENVIGQWQEGCVRLTGEFEDGLQQLQMKFATDLSEFIKNLIPEGMDNVVDVIDNEQVFSDIRFEFSKIINDFLESGNEGPDFIDAAATELKHHHDTVGKLIDERFKTYRHELEGEYRRRLGGQQPPSRMANEHNEKLSHLRSQYERYLQLLEKTYIESLKLFDEYLNTGDMILDTDFQQTQEDGRFCAYMWGSGKDGRIGNDAEEDEQAPTPIYPDNSSSVASVVCGYHHSAAITEQGQLYTWGRGVYGQLGHGSTEGWLQPRLVASLSSMVITDVACGWQHTAVLDSDGRIFTWGYGEDGQLGHGNTSDFEEPRLLEYLQEHPVTQIACGHSHSGCITGGNLYMWGCNPDSRLFIEGTEPKLTPTKVAAGVIDVSLGVSHSAYITEDGEVFTAGLGQEGQLGFRCDNFTHLRQVEGFDPENGALSVACGDSFTVILSEHQQVYSFGKGTHGRLGHGTDDNEYEPRIIEALENERVTEISAGCRHAGAVTSNGKCYLWGFNFYNQLGFAEGDKDYFEPKQLTSLPNVRSISCGYFHTGALTYE